MSTSSAAVQEAPAQKVVIDGLDGFRALVGKRVGTSAAVEVTQEKIEEFCRAVDNDEWIHWDIERCKKSPFGTTIAPGMFTQAYFSKLWFEMVDIRNIKNMLFMGSDRVRLLAPLKCGSKFTMTVDVAKVEERDKGIAVFYDVTWNVVGADKPVTVATFIIRYMD
jgi:acyl dehydratase